VIDKLDVRLEDLKVTLNDMLDDYQEAIKEGKVICLSYLSFIDVFHI